MTWNDLELVGFNSRLTYVLTYATGLIYVHCSCHSIIIIIVSSYCDQLRSEIAWSWSRHVRFNVRDGCVSSRSAVAQCSVSVRLYDADFRRVVVVSARQFRHPRHPTRTRVAVRRWLPRTRRPRPLQRGSGSALRRAVGRQGRAVRLRTVLRSWRKFVDDPDGGRWRRRSAVVGSSLLPAITAVCRPQRSNHVDRDGGRLPATTQTPSCPVRLQLSAGRDGQRRPILRQRRRRRNHSVRGRYTATRVWTTYHRLPRTCSQPRLQSSQIYEWRHRRVFQFSHHDEVYYECGAKIWQMQKSANPQICRWTGQWWASTTQKVV